MSPNLAVKHSDPNRLETTDLLFAGLVHLLVIVVIATLSWWQSISKPEPLKRIEVSMISAKELKNMQIAEKMRSIQKKRAVKQKATPKLKPKAKKKAPAEEAFDPFAPVQSESDVTAKSVRNDMADTIGKQLSAQEIERYIAMMKQAIQDRWKVASDVGKVTNPLVEVVLSPNGKVVSARIIDSSGNPSLDQSLLTAIYAAQPYQVPPRTQFEPFRVNNIWFEPLK